MTQLETATNRQTMQIAAARGLSGESRVDREAGIIYGARVISLGLLHPADVRPFKVDETTALEIATAINDSPRGIKGRFTHPMEPIRAGLGTYLGRWRNAVIDSLGVRADLHVAKAASQTPHGDLRGYVVDLAQEDPEAFGCSVHLLLDEEAMEAAVDSQGFYPIRLRMLRAVDVVDEPATSQGGLFSVLTKEEKAMPAETKPAVAAETVATPPTTPVTPPAVTPPAEATLSVATSTPPAPAKLVPAQAMSVAEQLAAAKAEAAEGERKRAGEILALCKTAAHPELADKFIGDAAFGVEDVRKQLFEQLCKDRKTVGDDGAADLAAKADPDAEFKAEFSKDRATFDRFGISEEAYVRTRRRDKGLPVAPKAAAN